MRLKKEKSGFWSGALFGMFTGMASLLSYQYLSGILREPHLISKAVFSEEEQFENKEALAMFIAAENLRSGIQTRFLTRGLSKTILHAGYRNFRESWARDFGFATYGLIAVEQFEAVRETLEAFYWHQKNDGQLPVKMHSMNSLTRFLHSQLGREQPTARTLRPKYVSAHGAPSLDGQALLIIAALHYAKEAEDSNFLKEHWNRITSAMEWLQNKQKGIDGILLSQGAYSDWADSVARRGCVLYTNVIYWKALIEMAHTAASLNLNEEAVQLVAEAESISRAINERLWDPALGYFRTSESLYQLSSAGNLLAIVWGLATADQTASILNVMKEARMSEPIPTRVAYPSYPTELISIENRLGGLTNYHTDASWLWIGALHVIALTQHGDTEQARDVMERIANVIVRDRQVNEVHGSDGEPLSSFWYKSEAPLTWNAGLVLYAYQIYEKQLQVEANFLSMLEGTA